MRIPFVGASNPHRSARVSRERLLNGVVVLDQQGKFDRSCFARPGLRLFATLGLGEVRGNVEWKGSVYAVVGDDVIKVGADGGSGVIGQLQNTISGPVIFAAGTQHLVFVDGDKGYYTQGSTVEEIVDPDFPDGATHVVWHSGNWLVNDPANDGRLWRSEYNDPTAWNALDFATAERDPDALKSLIVANQLIWGGGEFTTEAFTVDASDFGFSPVIGGFTEVGVAAPFSMAKFAGTVFWLGKSREGQGAIMRGAGIAGERISTEAIEAEIGKYPNIADATGFCFWWQGHGFYVLQFPLAGKTWVWDEHAQAWYEWTAYGGGAWSGISAVAAFGKTLIGSRDGKLYELTDQAHDDDGEPIEFWRYDRHLVEQSDRRWLFHNELEAEVETGAGTLEIDQTWMLRYSDDGGHTWSRILRRNSGKMGQRNKKLLYKRLGRSKDRIYAIGCADPCKRVLVGGYLNADIGA